MPTAATLVTYKVFKGIKCIYAVCIALQVLFTSQPITQGATYWQQQVNHGGLLPEFDNCLHETSMYFSLLHLLAIGSSLGFI